MPVAAPDMDADQDPPRKRFVCGLGEGDTWPFLLGDVISRQHHRHVVARAGLAVEINSGAGDHRLIPTNIERVGKAFADSRTRPSGGFDLGERRQAQLRLVRVAGHVCPVPNDLDEE